MGARSTPLRAAVLGVGLFLLSRIFVIVWAYLAPQDRTQPNVTWWSHNPLVRWDSGHYAGICNEGYPLEINDTTAFFPAYPLFCRGLRRWINTDDALVITSNFFALVGATVFFSMARKQLGAAASIRALTLLAVFPSAFFLSAGYSEGLFVACAAFALWFLQRGDHWGAALASAVATATRPPGVAIAVIVIASAIWNYRGGTRGTRGGSERLSNQMEQTAYRRWIGIALIAFISVGGLLGHMGFLAWHYGRPDAYFAAQQTWTPGEVRRPWLKMLTLHPLLVDAVGPLTAVVRGDPRRLLAHDTWDGFLGLVILVVAIRGLFARDWRIPRAWFLFPVVTFLLAYAPDPATGARLYGISRYQLAALPCFLRIADWEVWRKRPWLFAGVCLAMFVLQLANVAAFVNWQEAG